MVSDNIKRAGKLNFYCKNLNSPKCCEINDDFKRPDGSAIFATVKN